MNFDFSSEGSHQDEKGRKTVEAFDQSLLIVAVSSVSSPDISRR